MKKRTIVFLCMMAAAVTVFAKPQQQAGGDDSGDISLEKIHAKKRFVLGLDDSFPPMGFRNEQNEIVGYDVDLAKEVCRRLGWELVLQPIDWNAKEQELATGEIDCIWNGFTITDERKKALLFSPPYLKNAQVIVVKQDSPINSLSDLAGKRVGTQAGSSSVDAIDESPEFKNSLREIIEYKDFLTALMDLDAGGVDAVVADLVVANDSIGRSGKPLRKLRETLVEEEFGIGFRKNDLALEQEVWKTLTNMVTDGTVAQISEVWFGEDISVIGK
ncbi:MAG: amino acid ABC transporter substrate-binding protein [Spirochaetaceae bacterium]|jgi:polar amino acid transport system substrate-binding protein|nr:amino acid ABC transporter substrate-binding protein [Spirochaetaceae bacterium]